MSCVSCITRRLCALHAANGPAQFLALQFAGAGPFRLALRGLKPWSVPQARSSVPPQLGKAFSCVCSFGGCCGPSKEADEDVSTSSLYPPTPLMAAEAER